MVGWRKFKLTLSAIMLIELAAVPAAQADNAAGLNGNWARNDGTTRIAIAPCGADLCAVNTWVRDPNGKEKIGDKLILTLKPVSTSELQGPAFDVRRQMHYKMTVMFNGSNAMQTSGCVFLGILCKKADWTRVN